MQKKSTFWYLGAPFRFLYKIYFVLVFALLAIPLYPFFYFLLRSKKNVHIAFKLKRGWAIALLFFTGVKVNIQGKENLPKSPFIICANHASYLDIVVMFVAIPSTFLFLGKAELLKWPIVRIFFRNMDIPIDRRNSFKARESLELTKQAIRDGFTIAIFPEGLIPDENIPEMKPFKKGAFLLAISEEVPIVPITFSSNWRLFSCETDPWGAGRPGIAHVTIHSAISTKGKTEGELSEIRKQTFEVINSSLPKK